LATATSNFAQAPGWPDPVAEHVVPALTAGLVQGPMLGRPAATSVRIWLRTEKAMEFQIRYATHLPLDDESPTVQGETVGSSDNTGVVDLQGLSPWTRY